MPFDLFICHSKWCDTFLNTAAAGISDIPDVSDCCNLAEPRLAAARLRLKFDHARDFHFSVRTFTTNLTEGVEALVMFSISFLA